jgi:hypothetical protein
MRALSVGQVQALHVASGGPAIKHRPAQCDGVSNAELKRIVGRIIARQFGG